MTVLGPLLPFEALETNVRFKSVWPFAPAGQDGPKTLLNLIGFAQGFCPWLAREIP